MSEQDRAASQTRAGGPRAQSQPAAPDRPQLAEQVADHARELLASELALARAEILAQARQVSIGGAGLAAAAALAAVGGLALLAAAGLALAAVIPGWAAALIVAALLFVPAAVIGGWAVHRLSGSGRPLPRTLDSLRRDVRLVLGRARQ